MRKLNIGRLVRDNKVLKENSTEALHGYDPKNGDAEEQWKIFREQVNYTAADILGFVQRKHRDLFDENDAEIDTIISQLHEAHKQHIYKTCR